MRLLLWVESVTLIVHFFVKLPLYTTKVTALEKHLLGQHLQEQAVLIYSFDFLLSIIKNASQSILFSVNAL